MILAKIHNKFKMLTDAEKRIASFILSSYDTVPHMTVKELAKACNVAQSAVVRFSKTMEFDGFSGLKIALAGEVSKMAESEKLLPFNECDDTEVIFKKVFASGINTLSDTLKLLDFDHISKISELFINAKRIFIFGIGTSSTVALDASYRFSQLGLDAHAYTDILYMNVLACNMGKDDVAFCISHSGRTKVVLEAMHHAKKAGAKTVSLTSFADSPLYKECDLSVCVFADEENYPVEAVSARIAHMCTVDAFMMTIGTKKHGSVEKYIQDRNKILNEIRY